MNTTTHPILRARKILIVPVATVATDTATTALRPLRQRPRLPLSPQRVEFVILISAAAQMVCVATVLPPVWDCIDYDYVLS